MLEYVCRGLLSVFGRPRFDLGYSSLSCFLFKERPLLPLDLPLSPNLQTHINDIFESKIVNIVLSINFHICFGRSKKNCLIESRNKKNIFVIIK